jgi:hypothetical protein
MEAGDYGTLVPRENAFEQGNDGDFSSEEANPIGVQPQANFDELLHKETKTIELEEVKSAKVNNWIDPEDEE